MLSATAVRPFGNGTETSPYQVESLDNLQWISQTSTSWSAWFEQTADIDASATSMWNSGAGWCPIGASSPYFTGHYDGQGFTIDGLYINRPGNLNQAMFGKTVGATIINLGVENIESHGSNHCSGLVGYSQQSTITNCHATGIIYGSYIAGGLIGMVYYSNNITDCYSTATVQGSTSIGGLIGYCESENTISGCFAKGEVIGTTRTGGLIGGAYGIIVENCYAHGDVDGDAYSGGLIAYNENNTIENCYAVGSVSGSSNTGGLIGYSYNQDVTASFWNTETTGQSTSVGGTGCTTSEMRTESTFTDAGWGFPATWDINAFDNGLYPYLSWQEAILPGHGTEDDPFGIASLDDLRTLDENPGLWSTWLKQTADIDAADTENWNDGLGWLPIGRFINRTDIRFTGNYNGMGHTIRNLYINNDEHLRKGFFGIIQAASISNLGLTNVDISGAWFAGGLCGVGVGDVSISECYVTGSIVGNGDCGGLLAWLNDGLVSNCYTDVDINSGGNCGGLIYQALGDIENCYSRGSVHATNQVAGLVGYIQNASITNSYSTCNVTGRDCGGLVALIYDNSSVNNSFWDTEASGQSTSAGGFGVTTAQMKTQSTFTGIGWDFEGESVNGTNNYWSIDTSRNDGYPYLSWQVFQALISSSETQVDFGAMYPGQSSFSKSISIQNFGSIDLTITQINFEDGSQGFSYDLPLPCTIEPTAEAELIIHFSTPEIGNVSDTMLLFSNASISGIYEISLTGAGTSSAPLQPQNVELTLQGKDAVVTWDAVTQNAVGQTITPDGYVILYSETPEATVDDYLFLTFTTESEFTHARVVQYSDTMFYMVETAIDTDATRTLQRDLETFRGIRWYDVKERLIR